MENVVNNFYQGKKVLVTGHTGFKGGWLVLWLRELGANVMGYSLPPPTTPNLFEVAGLKEIIPTVIGDIRDKKALDEVFNEHKPEIVFHLAAQPIVRESYENPLDTIEINTLGTANVLQTIKKAGSVKSAVMVTTDKVYENKNNGRPFKESDKLGGYDPYSASKAAAEMIIASFAKSFKIAAVSARAGNVIGGGDWGKDRLVPDCARAFMAGRPVTVRYPDAIRPWQSVLDVVYGYLLLAKRVYEGGACSGGWNFGPIAGSDGNKSVRWIVETMAALWGGGASVEIDGGDHPAEAFWLALDCGRAAKQLRWRPRYDIGRALKSAVDWHKAFNDKRNMRQHTTEQIRSYLRDL